MTWQYSQGATEFLSGSLEHSYLILYLARLGGTLQLQHSNPCLSPRCGTQNLWELEHRTPTTLEAGDAQLLIRDSRSRTGPWKSLQNLQDLSHPLYTFYVDDFYVSQREARFSTGCLGSRCDLAPNPTLYESVEHPVIRTTSSILSCSIRRYSSK